MLHFGRSRSRRGLASALIGGIAALIDSMEGFEEVRKLEDMEFGADQHLTNSPLSQFRSSPSMNPMRIDWTFSTLRFSERLPIFSRVPVALPRTSMRSHRRKKASKELCKQHAIDAQKEINGLSELADDLLRDLRKLVSKKPMKTISRA